jgi:DNA-binding GntR family transcriptional regulator
MADLIKQRRMPLADAIYERLLDELMDGQRVPGEPLNIVVLSREYDASQTPIREALARLEHTGLVERQALKGYRVAPLFTERELLKLMDVRLILEPAMAFEAGRRLTPEFLDDLLDTIVALEGANQAPPDEAFRVYWKHDERFHGLIAKQTDNPFLEAAYASLGGQVQRFRLSGRLKSVDGLRAASEHRAVYDAFRRGDAKAAEQCMREHIIGARARVLDDVQQLRRADAL